jgi:hypothetical protein
LPFARFSQYPDVRGLKHIVDFILPSFHTRTYFQMGPHFENTISWRRRTMKRLIRILVLSGMVLMWLLISHENPVRAERMATSREEPERTVYTGEFYVGRISFIPRVDFQEKDAEFYDKLTTNGTVRIYFPKDDNEKTARIIFDGHRIDIEYKMVSRGKCWGVSYMWENGFGRINDAFSEYYDAVDESFKMPVRIGRLKTTTDGTQSSQAGIYCPVGGGDDSGKIIKISRFQGSDAWGATIKSVDLKLLEISDSKLGGDCTIEDWDNWNGNGYSSSLYCYWYAYYQPKQIGDWRKKK